MKLELLFKREPFKEIFSSSVSKFVFEFYNKKTYIKWIDFNFNTIREKNIFCYNSKLNIIYPIDINKQILYKLTKEYAYHPNFLKYFSHIIYILLFTQTFLRNKFRNKITFSNDNLSLNHLIFIPGNNIIRALDLSNGLCFVINKLEENNQIFQDKLIIRQQINLKSIPEIKHISKNYYEEELINAMPFNRLSNKKKLDVIINNVFNDLNKLYKQSFSSISLNLYIKRIDKLLLNKGILKFQDKNNVENEIKKLENLLIRDFKLTTLIPIALTHGDFQKSNILVNDTKYYIIDWEFIEYRFLYYDYLTFLFNARNPKGISYRINMWKCSNKFNQKVDNWPMNDIIFNEIISKKLFVVLFLIEELIFRLNENICSKSIENSGLNILLNEIKLIDLE
jgi:hypothetical protein